VSLAQCPDDIWPRIVECAQVLQRLGVITGPGHHRHRPSPKRDNEPLPRAHHFQELAGPCAEILGGRERHGGSPIAGDLGCLQKYTLKYLYSIY